MRITPLLLFILFLLNGCSEKENMSLRQELQAAGDPLQTFTIVGSKNETVTAKRGTIVQISAGVLVFEDGSAPGGPITVEVTEVYDKSEMILNGLSTTSDGKLLESFGMVNIVARSEGRNLKIKDGGKIVVTMPRKDGQDAELFYGVKSDSSVSWKLAEEKNDSMDLIGGMLESGPAVLPPFEFNIRRLGWINCDRFLDQDNLGEISGSISKYNHAFGYLVLSEIKSIATIQITKDGMFRTIAMPMDMEADVIFIDKVDGKYYWVKKHAKAGSDLRNLELKKISKEDLLKEIKAFDK